MAFIHYSLEMLYNSGALRLVFVRRIGGLRRICVHEFEVALEKEIVQSIIEDFFSIAPISLSHYSFKKYS